MERDLETARARFERAHRSYLEEKSPERSLIAKLHDAVVHTPVEEEFEAARAHLAQVEERLQRLLPRWLEDTINQEIAASHDPYSRQLLSMRPAILAYLRRSQAADRLADLAATACAELEDAADQCGRASSSELRSALSTLAISKEYADNETKEASHAISKAISALKKLSSEMEAIRASGVDESDRQWWSTALDVHVPEFSGSAIAALDRAQQACLQTLSSARDLHGALVKIKQDQEDQWSRELSRYQATERPIRMAALQRLPETLRRWLSEHAPSLDTWDGNPTPNRWLDLGALERARG